MKPERVQLFEVGRRQLLRCAAIVEFVERIVPTLHARIEKIAGIGAAAIVGQFGIAPVDREIGSRGGGPAQKQPCAGAREAKKVENVGLRTERDATERVGQLMQCNADQQVRIDVGSKGSATIVGASVIS